MNFVRARGEESERDRERGKKILSGAASAARLNDRKKKEGLSRALDREPHSALSL